jgi:hypothetical protein
MRPPHDPAHALIMGTTFTESFANISMQHMLRSLTVSCSDTFSNIFTSWDSYHR